MSCEDIEGFEFIVEKTEDAGYVARSFGACIITEADDIEELGIQIRDAICCHFDDGCQPGKVVLRFVEVVNEEILEG